MEPTKTSKQTTKSENGQGFLAFSNKVSLGGMAACAAIFVFNPLPALYPLAVSLFPGLVLYWSVMNGTPLAWKHRRQIGRMLVALFLLVRRGGKSVVTAIPSIPSTEGTEIEKKGLLSVLKKPEGGWDAQLPHPLSELPRNPKSDVSKPISKEWASEQISDALRLANFVVEDDVQILDIKSGPTLQQIIFSLPPKIQFTMLLKKLEDLKIHMGYEEGFTIMKPGPGFKSAAGFTLPNEKRSFVYLRDLAPAFLDYEKEAEIPFVLGRDIVGNVRFSDIAKLPHVLIGGETNSGKSVFINLVITSIMCVRTPKQVEFVMIDPKAVELNIYNGSPYLRMPVVTDMQRVPLVLDKLAAEMDKRYETMMHANVRNISEYNAKMRKENKEEMSYIVIIIDEFKDLKDVGDGKLIDHFVGRITQKARAAGIHLLLGTQSPRASVLGGAVKANIPARICFKVSGGLEYGIVMNNDGEKYPNLLGYGDGMAKLGDGSKFRFQSAAIGNDGESTEFIMLLKRRSAKKQTNKQDANDHFDHEMSSSPAYSSRWVVEEEETFETPKIDAKPSSLIVQKSNSIVPESWVHSEDEIDSIEDQDEIEDETLHEDSQPDELPEDDEEEVDQDLLQQALTLAQLRGGLSASLLEKNLHIPYSQSIELMKSMKDQGILGEYDDELGMLAYNSEPTISIQSEEELKTHIQIFICRNRRINTTELHKQFNIRRQRVSDTIKILVQEGMLEVISSKPEYRIAWSEEQIETFLEEV